MSGLFFPDENESVSYTHLDKKIIVKYGNIKAMQIAVNGKPAPAEKVDGVVIKEYKK